MRPIRLREYSQPGGADLVSILAIYSSRLHPRRGCHSERGGGERPAIQKSLCSAAEVKNLRDRRASRKIWSGILRSLAGKSTRQSAQNDSLGDRT